MKMSNTYYLCGFMGAGKSSILNKFQQQSNYSTIDLDSYIENKYGGIDKIFEEKGESYFRTIEEKEFFNHQNKFNIMAIGGGAVENNDIFQYLIDCKIYQLSLAIKIFHIKNQGNLCLISLK